MHRMTAAAICDWSRPPGHSHDHSGSIACGPARSRPTLTRAITLATINTANWMNMRIICIRSLMTMPRMLIQVIVMMKELPSNTRANRLSARASSPRSWNR